MKNYHSTKKYSNELKRQYFRFFISTYTFKDSFARLVRNVYTVAMYSHLYIYTYILMSSILSIVFALCSLSFFHTNKNLYPSSMLTGYQCGVRMAKIKWRLHIYISKRNHRFAHNYYSSISSAHVRYHIYLIR